MTWLTHKVDRSRIVARQECETLRFLNYHIDGTGRAPLVAADALSFGIALHEALETVLKQCIGFVPDGSITVPYIQWDVLEQTVYTPHRQQLMVLLQKQGMTEQQARHLALEQAYLMRQLVYGWCATRLPAILAEYKVVAVEQEFTVPFGQSNFELMLRLDTGLRRRSDDCIFILDFKTLKYLSDDWMVHHERSLQTFLYIWAMEKACDEYCGGVLYEGFVKGMTKKESKGQWAGMPLTASALCYSYVNRETGDWTPDYTAKKGYIKVPNWEEFIHPADAMVKLFKHYQDTQQTPPFWPNVPPIRPTSEEMETFVQAIAYNEGLFVEKLKLVDAGYDPNVLFEKNLGRCYKYGAKYGCPFAPVCHGGTDIHDETVYTVRTPHHVGEAESE